MSNKMDLVLKAYDDFEWDSQYPASHMWQVQQILKSGQSLELKEFDIVNGELVCKQKLHPLQLLLYKFIYYTHPQSVFEVGFGYVNHLLSIHKICPDIKISGCDISSAQYNNALRLYPELVNYNFNLKIQDFAFWKDDDKHDLVFSNAVIMHMSSHKALYCLQNMVHISNEWVVLFDGRLMLTKELIEQLDIHDIFYFDEFAEKYCNDYYHPPIFINKHRKVNSDLLYKIFHEIQQEEQC